MSCQERTKNKWVNCLIFSYHKTVLQGLKPITARGTVLQTCTQTHQVRLLPNVSCAATCV